MIKANQNRYNSSGISFTIEPVSVMGDYEINDNGILGFDNFTIEAK